MDRYIKETRVGPSSSASSSSSSSVMIDLTIDQHSITSHQTSTASSSSSSSSLSSSLNDIYHEANRHIFGHDSFRPHQLEIIQSILQNKDVFVVMPTGGGKTLCYSLPAVLSKGVTVVISPLISLIEDQVSALIQLPNGGIPAAYLTSSCTTLMARDVLKDLQRCRSGVQPFLKLLYLTPERIVKAQSTKQILDDLYGNEMLARFVIDEAHCVSAWGHDFRKDYASLDLLKSYYPETPIVLFTATARERVIHDVLNTLHIPIQYCKRFHTGFDRPNLYFRVIRKTNYLGKI